MSNGNNVTITGNATRDPDMRYTNGGRAVVQLGMAVNDRYQVNGEWQERVNFFNVTVWGDLAENVAATVTKGMRLTVAGRLAFRQWEDKTDGSKRSAVDITADDVAVSLRFATAEVQKNERSNGGSASPPAEAYEEEPF